MNQLTKFLLEDLLGNGKKKITAIYGGGFKPPTKGHFDVIKKAADQNPEIDDIIIYVGSGERNGITQGESIQIWELYKKYLPMKVQIEPVKSPIGDILRYAKDHPEEEVLWIIGARENNPEDFADISSRTRTLDKYPNLQLRVIQTSGGVSGTATRNAVKANDKEQFFKMIPNIAEKQQVWDIVSPVIKEIVTDTEVICDNCGWEWPIADGGDDLYICHNKLPDGSICGHDNNPDLDEGSCGYDTDVATGKKLNTPGGLEEGKQVGPLYHYTSADGLKGILSSNRINASEEYYLGNDLYYISFTRNKNFHNKGSKFGVKTEYRITLDGNKLSNKYKIKPFAYTPGWNYENWEYDWLEDEPENVVRDFFNNTGDYDEQEERISFKGPEGGIDNIKNYILSVDKVKDLQEILNDPFGLNELARQFMDETLKEMWKPEESFVSLSKYMIDNGMNIKPLPKIKVISDDKDNASNLLGKTAYYNPTDKLITLYTMDRHPKDILRSFAHEMIHHEQNLEGKLNNINTTNTNEDGALPEIEREAYEKGNMMLRNWEDNIKDVQINRSI